MPSQPNKRQLERLIRLTERDLAAIERREIGPLTMREKRSILGRAAMGTAQLARGKGDKGHGSAVDRHWAAFADKRRAEIAAARQMIQGIEAEEARARVAKRAGRWL
jgi:hypothetical protein